MCKTGFVKKAQELMNGMLLTGMLTNGLYYKKSKRIIK
jgi:hypothetical protein